MTIDPQARDFDLTALLAEVTEATARLLGTAEELDDQAAREPSLLPGWSRGHVLTHVARNADGMVHLLTWAATGERTDMYASVEARRAQIEAGSSRPAAELTADVRESAERFAEAAARLEPGQWDVKVERRTGGPWPACWIPWWRLEEVSIHHVDLDAGYSPAHWTPDFTGPALRSLVERFSDRTLTPEATAFRLHAEDTGGTFGVCTTPEDERAPLVRGPEAALLAWLIGRSSGDGLTLEPHGALPSVPAWM